MDAELSTSAARDDTDGRARALCQAYTALGNELVLGASAMRRVGAALGWLIVACFLVVLVTPARAEESTWAQLEGVVRDAEGEPVSGVEVSFWRSDGGVDHRWSAASIRARFEEGMGPRSVARTTTDAAGKWHLTVPHAGRYGHVAFLAADGRMARSHLSWAPPVARAPIVSVLFRPRRVEGRLVGRDGEPVSGHVTARVEPAYSDGSSYAAFQTYPVSTSVGADGRFSLAVPSDAEVVINAFAPGVGKAAELRSASDPALPLSIAFRRSAGPAVGGVILDAAGSPVGGAHVVAQLSVKPDHTHGVVSEVYTTSDAEGRYLLRDLPAAHVVGLAVWKEGYAVSAFPPDGTAGMFAVPSQGQAGEAFQLDLPLVRGRTIRGRVVDESGKSVPGARVWFEPEGRGALVSRIAGTTTKSDANGDFSLKGLGPRAGFVRARSATHRLASYWNGAETHGQRIARGSSDLIEGVRLVLARGESVGGRLVDGEGKPVVGAAVRLSHMTGRRSFTGQDVRWSDEKGRFAFFGLQKIEYPSFRIDAPGFAKLEARLSKEGGEEPTIRLWRAGSMTGRVLDSEGRPVVGTSVRCNSTADVVTTNRDGGFHMPRQPPGRHELVLSGPGSMTGPGRAVVELAEGEVKEGIEIRLPGTTPSGGTAVIAGTVLDEKGQPVAGERIEIRPITGSRAPHYAGGHVVSDAQGRFRLEGLPHGQYVLQPWPPVRRPTVVPADTLDAVVKVTSRDTYVVEGRVVDPEGHPVPNGVIEASYNGDGRNVLRASSCLIMGCFRMHVRSAAPKYSLRFLRPRDVHGRPLNLIQQTSVEVSGPGEPLEIALVEAAALTGVVRDAKGQPVAGVLLGHTALPHGYPNPLDPGAESGADGAFRLTGLKPGRYRLNARVPQGWEAPASLEVKAPQAGIQITVKRMAAIRGRLLDAEGAPIADARVYATAKPRKEGEALKPQAHQRNAMMVSAHTDQQGRFHLRGLSKDFVYDLGLNLSPELRARHFTPPLKRIEPGRDDVEIRLSPATTISGRVLTPEGLPVSKASVFAHGPLLDDGQRDPRSSASGATDADGNFEIGPLDPEALVTLGASIPPNAIKPGHSWLPTSRDDILAGSSGVDLILGRDVQVTGRMEGVTPAELLRSVVYLAEGERRKRRRLGSYRFDGKGNTFRIVGLAPGTYTLYVQSANREVMFAPVPNVKAPSSDIVVRRYLRVRLWGRLTGVDAKGWVASFQPLQPNPRQRRPRNHPVGDDGTFQLGSMPNDPGVLLMTSPDQEHAVWLELTPTDKPLAVQAVRTKMIKGRIRNLPRKVLNGRVVARRGPFSFKAKLETDGYFTMKGLPPGRYDLEVENAGFRDSATGVFEPKKDLEAGDQFVTLSWSPGGK